MTPLPHPETAEYDDESVEVLRAWVVQGGLEIVIHPSHFAEQPDQWGRLLADAAEHMADAISEETGKDRSASFKAIIAGFREHLEHPSPDRDGKFLP